MMLFGTAIFSVGIFNGFILSLVSFKKKRPNLRFAGFILVLTIILSKYLLSWLGHQTSIAALSIVAPWEWLVGPLVYFMNLRDKKFRTKELRHYIPFIAHVLFLLIFNTINMSREVQIMPVFIHLGPFKLIHELIYFSALVIPHKNSERVSYEIPLLFIVQILVSIFYLLEGFPMDNIYLNIGLILIIVFTLNIIIYRSIRESPYLSSPQNTQPSTFSSTDDRLFIAIGNLIEKEKLFLNGNLKILDIAKRLNESEKNISRVINLVSNENFNAYINRFRVQYAARLLNSDTHKNYTIEVIAEDSGFANKVSFYKAFKRVKGMSPTEFKKSVENPPRKQI